MITVMESLLTEAQNDQLERCLKHEMVMKRWSSLYDREGAQKLKKAMMRHVYKLKHGEVAMKTAEDFSGDYNPLNI